MQSLPRMNLHLRIQHGVLLLAVMTALATGLGTGGGMVPTGIGFDRWYRLHLGSGMLAAGTVGYHLLYLLIRGYVEGKQLFSFPLSWRRGDWKELRDEATFVWGAGERPEAGIFRVSQKFLYWGTGLFLLALAATGTAVGFWEHFDSHAYLSSLGLVAHLHRGVALLLLGSVLWHLYGSFFWEGAWSPQWTWLSGTVPEELARVKVPGFHRESMKQLEEHRKNLLRKSAEDLNEEERRLEREKVERDLQEGNRLAREEKYVDALYHYRRALEQYPGYSQARYNMAVVLRKMGERTMARDNFLQFLREDSFHPLARRAQEFIAELEEEEEEGQ